jgi:hypothetical protein
MCGVRIDGERKVRAEREHGQAQESLALRGFGMTLADASHGELSRRARGRADERRLLAGRHFPPAIDLPFLDIRGRVLSEQGPRAGGLGALMCGL